MTDWWSGPKASKPSHLRQEAEVEVGVILDIAGVSLVRWVWKMSVRETSSPLMILLAVFTMRCSLLPGGGVASIPHSDADSDDALNGASVGGAHDGRWYVYSP